MGLVLGSASLSSRIFFFIDSSLVTISIMFSFLLIILGDSKFVIIKFASGKIDIS